MTNRTIEVTLSPDIHLGMLSYSHDDDQLTVCRATGHLDFLQVARVIEQILGDPTTREHRSTLFVFSDVESFISANALRALTPLVQHWSERVSHQRWAVVVPNHTCHDLARIALPALNLQAAEVECFVSEVDALNWLEADFVNSGGSV